MGDGEPRQLGMAQQGAASRRPRQRAACGERVGKAVAAECGAHGMSRSPCPPSALRARATAAGSIPALSANAISRLSSASICSSTPARKPGSRGRCANLGRPDSGDGEKTAKPLRLLGDEGKRLNRQHFRRFPRWSTRALFMAFAFAFP